MSAARWTHRPEAWKLTQLVLRIVLQSHREVVETILWSAEKVIEELMFQQLNLLPYYVNLLSCIQKLPLKHLLKTFFTPFPLEPCLENSSLFCTGLHWLLNLPASLFCICCIQITYGKEDIFFFEKGNKFSTNVKIYKSYISLKSSTFRFHLLSPKGVNETPTPPPFLHNKSALACVAAVTTAVCCFTDVSTEHHNKEYHVLKKKKKKVGVQPNSEKCPEKGFLVMTRNATERYRAKAAILGKINTEGEH